MDRAVSCRCFSFLPAPGVLAAKRVPLSPRRQTPKWKSPLWMKIPFPWRSSTPSENVQEGTASGENDLEEGTSSESSQEESVSSQLSQEETESGEESETSEEIIGGGERLPWKIAEGDLTRPIPCW